MEANTCKLIAALQEENRHNFAALKNNRFCEVNDIVPYRNDAFLQFVGFVSSLLGHKQEIED